MHLIVCVAPILVRGDHRFSKRLLEYRLVQRFLGPENTEHQKRFTPAWLSCEVSPLTGTTTFPTPPVVEGTTEDG
jgi:hypothetical protein